MADIADLHMHTIYSDGKHTPEELLHLIKQAGIKAFSITDHDTVDGIRPMLDILDDSIDFIPGIEISCHYNKREIHLLGYGININSDYLLQHLDDFKKSREDRAKKILTKLQNLDVDLELEQIQERTPNNTIARPHIAAELVTQGYANDLKDAFSRYLYDNGPAYEAKVEFPIEAAIKLVKKSGGISVIAHPGRMVTEQDVRDFFKLGMDGIEVLHPNHSLFMQKKYHNLAKMYNAVETGGSDFHGLKDYELSNLGKFGIPIAVFNKIRNSLK
jgi:predicted metal-dependent phosphoesterase TrpH